MLLSITANAQSTTDGTFQALLKQGFALHQRAQFVEAIPVLERARRLEPEDYFANLLLGIDLLRTGKPSEALPRLEFAARKNPGEEIPEEYLGETETRLGHFARAAEAYRQAVERGRGSEQSLEAWAEFSMERFRQIGESLRASDEGVATVRKLQAAAANPGGSLVCSGSIAVLEGRLAGKPAGSPSQAALNTAYELSICYAVEAGKAAEQLQASGGDAAELHRLRGDVLLRLKSDPAGAEREYTQAIAQRAGDPALEERLAEAQLSAGEPDAARQSAEAALSIDPHRTAAQRTLASLAMSNRNYDQALPWLQQLATEAPSDLAVQVELSKALAQTDHAKEALQHLTPVLAAGYPDEKGALHSLEARLLRSLGRDAEAASAAAEARRLSDQFQNKVKDGGHAGDDGP